MQQLRIFAVIGAAWVLGACQKPAVEPVAGLSSSGLVGVEDDRPDHRCGLSVAGAKCGERRFCSSVGLCEDIKAAAHDLYDDAPPVLIEKIESLPCVRDGSTYEMGGFVAQPTHYVRSFRLTTAVRGGAVSCYEDELRPMFRESIVLTDSGPQGTNAVRLSIRTTR